MKLGPARTITHYKHLIHIINLDSYTQNILKIEKTLNHFENTQFNQIAVDTTKLKLKELENKLNQLKPINRRKRGLINAMGSTIKFITGNMDYEDAERINKNIDHLLTQNGLINSTLNQQLILNTNMINRFENITNHINNEQHLITQSIKHIQDQARNSLNPAFNTITQIQQLNRINYNIDILTQHLNNIAESIVLAKLNIIPKLILDNTELLQIHQILNTTINILSAEHLFELLELAAYYNNTNIIFNIQIPIISNIVFSLYHIIPTPINKTLEIICEKYALINENNLIFYNKKCKEIENQFYCKHFRTTEYNMNANCIRNIVNRNETTSCHLRDIGQKTDIIHPEPNFLILINPPKQQITSVCNSVTKQYTINSTTLIQFVNCKIAINNIWYDSENNTHWDNGILIDIPPNFVNKITVLSNKDEITLPKLNEYRFQDKIIIDNLQTNTETHKKITYSSLGSIIILFSILAIVIAKRKPMTINYSLDQQFNEAPAASCPKPLWPSLHFKEGGVTLTQLKPTTTHSH